MTIDKDDFEQIKSQLFSAFEKLDDHQMRFKSSVIDDETKLLEIRTDGDENASRELDMYNQHHLIQKIEELFDGNAKVVIINMATISYIDSSGIWGLYESQVKGAQNGKKIKLMNLSNNLKRIFKATKMLDKIELIDSI